MWKDKNIYLKSDQTVAYIVLVFVCKSSILTALTIALEMLQSISTVYSITDGNERRRQTRNGFLRRPHDHRQEEKLKRDGKITIANNLLTTMQKKSRKMA